MNSPNWSPSISQHLKPGTVLFELKRLGIVEVTSRGVKRKMQLPGTIQNPEDGFELLSQDLDTLITAVTENIVHGDSKISNLHIRTEYDNIYVKDLEKAKWWLIEERKSLSSKSQKVSFEDRQRHQRERQNGK